ncbi:amidophosphoribosyltransferase [Flavobacterium album]|uniref:Amidophosphoribosyltransferase n=1 Tax=Flavobacterium album TaxID=2175091 RepID=A0A2S1QV06_9FLAO|nr:phosphoribosyltransferase family protein [Flavobacterium album]AWH84250.1 amidophosphoribosyltransferase [Flavobacterium album]
MLSSLFNLLFPKTCNGCDGLLLESEDVVCTACRHDMPFTLHHLNAENETFKKFYGRLPLEHASAFLYFHKEGMVQQMVHNLKYRKQQEVGRLLGQLHAEDLKTVEALKDVTDIIPVPMHPKKLRQRGYNQVTEFGKALAEGLGKNYNEAILVKKVHTQTQTKKNLAARAAIANAFDVNFTEADSGRHFLLIDDVITTGSTLEACGRELLKIPGAKVSIVTMAYAH